MIAIRKATGVQHGCLDNSLRYLKLAMKFAQHANCPRLSKKIGSAIKSAGGAERHMRHRLRRTQEDVK